MPIRQEAWPQGTPCWVDCQLDDPIKGREFYAELFGWDMPDMAPEAGGYLIAFKNGQPAAALGPTVPSIRSASSAHEAPGPSVWTTYLATDDADATQAKILAAGGTVLAPVFDVLDAGRMLMAADPTGGVFGVWQSGSNTGANVYNEHGAYVWNDLHTRDYTSAKTFYADVFDWGYQEMGDGENMIYSVFALPDDPEAVLGGIQMDAGMPDGAPAYWLAWFQSDDVDASFAKATDLGASVLMPPEDSPFGYLAVVAGPQGEVFGLFDVNRTVPEG